MKKTQKTNKSAACSPRTGNERAANTQRTRSLFVPIMKNFRSYLRKDVANAPQIWLPIECNLIFRYEFAACSLQTRYLFVAILLYCAQRGIDEIPDDKRFLALVLNADTRTIEKSIAELESFGLLLERKKEREIRKDTDRQKETPAGGVSVNSQNLSQNGGESEREKVEVNKQESPDNLNGNSKSSEFSIEECLRYVEAEVTKGATINNPKALAHHLFKSGEADSFIRAALYPEQQKEVDREIYGEPRQFSLDPCRVCFGAKFADIDGRGFRACEHCKNERGRSTGYEPEGVKSDE